MTKYKRIQFDYKHHVVDAEVYIGKTGATGDDPTEVVNLGLSDWNGNELPLADDLYEDLVEQAIIIAKGV